MKNSTMPWFWKQNRDYKNKIINLAKKRSDKVRREEQRLLEGHRRKRKINRKAEEGKAKLKRAKQAQKQEELAKIEIIQTTAYLDEALSNDSGTTPKQIQTSKICILKQQLEARLNQHGKRLVLVLSHKGRKKTSEDLLRELTILIEEEEETRQKERDNLKLVMSHGKPSLANHIMRFICTTFRFALLGFGKYFAGSTQTAVRERYVASFPGSPPARRRQ